MFNSIINSFSNIFSFRINQQRHEEISPLNQRQTPFVAITQDMDIFPEYEPLENNESSISDTTEDYLFTKYFIGVFVLLATASTGPSQRALAHINNNEPRINNYGNNLPQELAKISETFASLSLVMLLFYIEFITGRYASESTSTAQEDADLSSSSYIDFSDNEENPPPYEAHFTIPQTRFESINMLEDPPEYSVAINLPVNYNNQFQYSELA